MVPVSSEWGFIRVDGAGVEAPNPNPLDAAAGVALADGADDGKLNPGAEAEVVVAAELAGSEKEGIAGDDMLNKEDDVGVAADDVVDPNLDAPKSKDEEAWVWLGVAVDAPASSRRCGGGGSGSRTKRECRKRT